MNTILKRRIALFFSALLAGLPAFTASVAADFKWGDTRWVNEGEQTALVILNEIGDTNTGKCRLEIDGKKIKCKWSFRKGALRIKLKSKHPWLKKKFIKYTYEKTLTQHLLKYKGDFAFHKR